MAGHSKWANIQHRKNAQDKKRGKIFTRLIREITVAARGGGDPDHNSRLRLALDRASAANLPKDSANRAVARGSGALTGVHLEDVVYEGYAKGGVAVLIDCTTDNRNRTVAEVRHAFSKNQATMADNGSVAYLFRTVCEVRFDRSDNDEKIFELATDAEADDVELTPESLRVTIRPSFIDRLTGALLDNDLPPSEVDTVRVPDVRVPVVGDDIGALRKLIEALEELDDTVSVTTNADFIDEP